MKIENELSPALHITIGVPQGSILGPLPFILYVNDSIRVVLGFLFIMYADETTLLGSVTDSVNLVIDGNTELKLFHDWSLANRLSINFDKTFCIIFGIRSVEIDEPSLDNVQIEAKTISRFLRKILDDNLKFNHHLTFIADKVSKSIGILHKLRSHLPFSCLEQF